MATTQTIFDDATQALNARDYDKFEALHEPQADVWQPGMPGKDVKAQIEGLKVLAAGFPDGRWIAERPIQDGDRCSAEHRFEGTQTGVLRVPGVPEIQPTGKKVTLNASVVVTLEAGKVSRARIYTDRMQLVEQLGLAPAPEKATV
jgi:predicted ester cyclase